MALKDATRQRYLSIYRDIIRQMPRREVAEKHGCSLSTIRKAIAYFRDQSQLSSEEELQIQIQALEARIYHLRRQAEQIEDGLNETEVVTEGERKKRVKKKRVYRWSAAASYWREIRESEKELAKLKRALQEMQGEGKDEGDVIGNAVRELEEEGGL